LLALAVGGCSAPEPDPYVVSVDLTESIRALGSDDLDVSEAAADRISSFGLAALPALERAVGVESAAVRARAVEVAASVGEHEAVPLLLRAASDPAPSVRAEAVLALGSLDDERGRDRVEAALADPSIEVRRAAADGCATLCRSPQAFARLVEIALGEPTTPRMLVPRQSLRVALKGAGAEAARAAILLHTEPILSSTAAQPEQRARAALLLADAGDARAPALLAEAVRSDADAALRTQAAIALGISGDPAALPVLQQALEQDSGLPRAVVCRSLLELSARGVLGAATAHSACIGDSPP
jgi:HEAT repeat protein